MTAKGFERALRSFARRTPFQSFFIEFVSGATIRAVHPEAADIRGNLVLHIAADGRQRLFDCTSVCQLIEDSPERARPDITGDTSS